MVNRIGVLIGSAVLISSLLACGGDNGGVIGDPPNPSGDWLILFETVADTCEPGDVGQLGEIVWRVQVVDDRFRIDYYFEQFGDCWSDPVWNLLNPDGSFEMGWTDTFVFPGQDCTETETAITTGVFSSVPPISKEAPAAISSAAAIWVTIISWP